MKIRKARALRLTASIFFLALAMGCSNPIPSTVDLERRSEFVDVLVDVQLLEAAYKQKIVPKEEIDSLMQANYKLIFQKHGISQTEFDEEFNFWKMQPEQITTIYTEVVERLNKLDKELREQAEEEGI